MNNERSTTLDALFGEVHQYLEDAHNCGADPRVRRMALRRAVVFFEWGLAVESNWHRTTLLYRLTLTWRFRRALAAHNRTRARFASQRAA